ncbi:long-chain-fatty-acid--CoA ligase [Campylobacter sp. 19-13652]|uniref:long-chain-fatty-acid--CoA ligase n=1 Tax=Campylobacter sp. 19-13652 TaxID=2840180 RepID=UPI001C76FECD|nr:long-chain-fatty-acid--CoA ligase [Campylobacter sp. 19-13652]BCX78854.1 long-chain-fatty-acid--CoA ligase [Campylobacter sp. 19-13652]
MGQGQYNLYEILSQIASTNGSRIAIFDDKARISYKGLFNSVGTLAGHLQAMGVSKGDRVAMVVANSSEFVISYLAITATAAVAVPINTFLKSEEIAYILKDCEARVLFASASLRTEIVKASKSLNLEHIIYIGANDEVASTTASVDQMGAVGESMYLDMPEDVYAKVLSYESLLTSPSKLIPPIAMSKEDLVHIIYTSGTTGKPKGAMISYRNIISNINGAHEQFVVRGSDRFLVFLPMFHSFTLTAMVLLPLVCGASIIIMRSIFPFSNVLKQALLKRATIFLGVPAIYTAIGKAKIPWYFSWFNKIRLFICGGAPLAKQTIDDFKLKFPRAKLIEGYGLSECSPIVSANPLKKQKPLSVGVPLAGYSVKIVDDEMIERARGEIGEIIVSGDCVMQGYLGMPAASDETIINGWLRTGDLGYMDDEGYIYIVDRKKDLIISKGINIYPREIEEAILKIDEVEAAAVIGVRDEHADEEVVAFIQLKDEANISEAMIRKFLKQHLANFKIPKSIHFRNDLPKNATGKVLKRVLKDEINSDK